MEILAQYPELSHVIIVFLFKAFLWIMAIVGVFILLLVGIIGYFARNQLSDIKQTFKQMNKNIEELFGELRYINRKVGRYDQIADEHNKVWGEGPTEINRREKGVHSCSVQVEDSQAG